jgi:hypothetical protein
MKKITICLMILCFFSCYPVKSNAENPETAAPLAMSMSAKPERLLHRLNEIKTMDISKLDRSDRKKLRIEVLSVQDQLSKLDGGVYLSVGAIIIILLLLILLL